MQYMYIVHDCHFNASSFQSCRWYINIIMNISCGIWFTANIIIHIIYITCQTVTINDNIKWLAMIRSSSTLLHLYRFNIYINPEKKWRNLFRFSLSAFLTKNVMIYFDFLFIYLFRFVAFFINLRLMMMIMI